MGSLFNQTNDTVSSSNTAQNGQQTQTTTPNLPSWLQSNFQGNVAQGQKLAAGAAQPVFGGAQQGSYTGAMNGLAQNDISNLNNTLASKGVTGGAAAQGAENINLANRGNQSAFLSSVPQLNQQASLQNQAAAVNGGLAAAKAVPVGQTTTGTSSGQTATQGTSDTIGNPGIAGILSSIAGVAGNQGGQAIGSGLGGLAATGQWSNPFTPAGGASAVNAATADPGTTGIAGPVQGNFGSGQPAPATPSFGNNAAAGNGGNMDNMFGQLFPDFSGGFGSPF